MGVINHGQQSDRVGLTQWWIDDGGPSVLLTILVWGISRLYTLYWSLFTLVCELGASVVSQFGAGSQPSAITAQCDRYRCGVCFSFRGVKEGERQRLYSRMTTEINNLV